MSWTFLNGLLAFAVTMIVMSTVMAAIVEFIYTLRAKRRRYLRAFLLDFFDTQLLPNFQHKIVQLATASSECTQKSGAIEPDGWQKRLNKILSKITNLKAPFPVVFIAIMLICIATWTETLIIPALILILVSYFWDQHSQDARLNLGIDEATSKRLGLSPEAHAQLDRFRQNFVDEIAKKGADPENGKDYAERITPTEFASALGRSALGPMLVQTGRDRLDVLITDLLRRFDETGAQSVAEFKRKSTQLSVIAAFITAFVVNINAITLLAAYFEDDDLSARVIGLYSDEELAGMAGTLNAVENKAYVDLVKMQQKLNTQQEDLEKKIREKDALPDNTDKKERLEETIANAKKSIEQLRSEINGTVATLTAIGTPVGWRYFPFCLPDASGRRPGEMPGCKNMSSYSDLLAKESKKTPSKTSDGSDNLFAKLYKTVCDHSKTVCDHSRAIWGWLEERQPNLLSWFMGVLLSGVLIGLGGPFWFDFYRRLATVTQIARNFGVAQPRQQKSQQDGSSPPKADESQTKHSPNSALEAFKESVEAKRVMTDVPAPRRLLNADGT